MNEGDQHPNLNSPVELKSVIGGEKLNQLLVCVAQTTVSK